MKRILTLAFLPIFAALNAQVNFEKEDIINGERFGHLQLRGAMAIEYNSNTEKFYVADLGNKRLLVLNADGTVFQTITATGCADDFPVDVALNSNGIYASARCGDETLIYHFDHAGNQIRSFPSGGFKLAMDPLGKLFSLNGGAIWEFDDQGSVVKFLSLYEYLLVEPNPPFPNQIHAFARGFAVDAEGNFFISADFSGPESFGQTIHDHQLLIVDKDGSLINKINVAEKGFPFDVTIDRFSNVYLVDIFQGIFKLPSDSPETLTESSIASLVNYLPEYQNLPLVSSACHGPDGLYTVGGHNRIAAFNIDSGEHLKTILDDLNPGQLNSPGEMAIHPNGNVYVTDELNNRIQVFDTHGNFVMKFADAGDGKVFQPHEIAIDPGGYVYVNDKTTLIKVFDGSGNFIRSLDIAVASQGHISKGGLAVDNDHIYINFRDSNEIRVYTKDGNHARTISLIDNPNHPFDHTIWDLALDKNGNLYVAGSFIYVYTNGGEFMKIITPGGSSVAVDANDHVYVLSGRGFIFNAEGELLQQFEVPDDARGVAIAGSRMYISRNLDIDIWTRLPEPETEFLREGNYSDWKQPLVTNPPSGLQLAITDGDAAHLENSSIVLDRAGSITIEASFPGTDTHRKSTRSFEFTVNKGILEVTANNASKLYGDENPDLTITFTGFRFDDSKEELDMKPDASTSANELSDAGAYCLTLSPGVDDCYDFTYQTGILTIEKAPLTVTVIDQTVSYGQQPAYDLQYSGFKNAEDHDDIDSSPMVTTSTPKPGAGIHTLSAAGGSDNNYFFSEYTPGTLTVEKTTLQVNAKDETRLYKESNPEFTALYSGFVYDENVEVLEMAPLISCAATENSNVGQYTITVSGGLQRIMRLSISTAH